MLTQRAASHASSPARFVTATPEPVWPVLPTPVASGALSLQYQLEQSQWLSADALAERQLLQLTTLLRHARRTSPFYEMRLEDLDLAAGLERAAFAELPALSRADVQGNADALRCRMVPPDHGELTRYASSGSTGRPVHVLGTRLNDLWWRALTLRDHIWQRRDFGGTLGVLKTRIKSATTPNWGAATAGVIETGPCVAQNSDIDIAEQASWLVAADPHYLLSHATNLRALAAHCLRHGIRPTRLREVRSYGEMLPIDLRELCREAWDVPVIDAYSSAELGVIALQCPEHEHYHVQSEHVLVEILDAHGRPCAPGTPGRVVVTNLHNFAMPLIRYELNDYATPGEACPCGRGLPVIARILGRRRNMLRVPDGTTHWPSFPVSVWGEETPIRQFQLVQAELECITVRLVAARRLTPAERESVCTRLNERLAWPFTYRIEYVDSIDDRAGFADFVCLLDDDA